MFFFVTQPLHASDFILVDFVVELFHKCGWQGSGSGDLQ